MRRLSPQGKFPHLNGEDFSRYPFEKKRGRKKTVLDSVFVYFTRFDALGADLDSLDAL